MAKAIVAKDPWNKRTYSSKLSFVGSARRITPVARRQKNPWLRWVFVWPAVIMGIGFAWALVTMWYVVAFGVFGLFTFPFRLFRRGSRQRKHLMEQNVALRDQIGTR